MVVTKGWMSALQELSRQTTRQITSWEEALRLPSIVSRLTTRQEIIRVWGPIGLFWALLLWQLKQGLRFSECEDCHHLNPGRKDKRYCGPDDDPVCYARRR